MNRYIRVYNGPENTNIIGFSASAVPDKEDAFEEFMTEKGYEVEPYTIHGMEANPDQLATLRKLGAVSWYFYGIEPPLKPEDEQALADWCEVHIDVSHDSGVLIDNRETPSPIQAYHNDGQRIISSW